MVRADVSPMLIAADAQDWRTVAVLVVPVRARVAPRRLHPSLRRRFLRLFLFLLLARRGDFRRIRVYEVGTRAKPRTDRRRRSRGVRRRRSGEHVGAALVGVVCGEG